MTSTTYDLQELAPLPATAAEVEELVRRGVPLRSLPLVSYQRALVIAGSPLFPSRERRWASMLLLNTRRRKGGPPYDVNRDLVPHLRSKVPEPILVEAIQRALEDARRPLERVPAMPPGAKPSIFDGGIRIPSLSYYPGKKNWKAIPAEIPDEQRVPWNWPFHNLIDNYLPWALREMFRDEEKWHQQGVGFESLVWYEPDDKPDSEPEHGHEDAFSLDQDLPQKYTGSDDAPSSYHELIADTRNADLIRQVRDRLVAQRFPWDEDTWAWYVLFFLMGVRAQSPRITEADWKAIFPGEPYDPERARSMPGVPGYSTGTAQQQADVIRQRKKRLSDELVERLEPAAIVIEDAYQELIGGRDWATGNPYLYQRPKFVWRHDEGTPRPKPDLESALRGQQLFHRPELFGDYPRTKVGDPVAAKQRSAPGESPQPAAKGARCSTCQAFVTSRAALHHHDCKTYLQRKLQRRRGDDPVEYLNMLAESLANLAGEQHRMGETLEEIKGMLAESYPDDEQIRAAVDQLIEDALAT